MKYKTGVFKSRAVEHMEYIIKCPYCHTEMHPGELGEYILMMNCWQCHRPLKVKWEEAIDDTRQADFR